MTNSEAAGVVVSLVAFLFCFAFGMWIIGNDSGIESKERQAIKAGVAEYRLDENFERQFHWKTNKP
jgi:hypothetical protein